MSDAQDTVRGAGESAWKLVPAEPTDEQLRAGATAWLDDPLRRSTTLYRAMLAAAPVPPLDQDGVLRALRDKAADQIRYWRERQIQEKSPEDGVSEDGETYTPIGDVAARQGGYCNGWYSSSDWWAKTIEEVAATTHRPADPVPGGGILPSGLRTIADAMQWEGNPLRANAVREAADEWERLRDATRSDRGGTDAAGQADVPAFRQRFLEAYRTACGSSRPDDWMDAALLAKQYDIALQQPPPVSPAPVGIGVEALDALKWYAEQARLCRLIHSEGDSGRHALSEDGGKRAKAILARIDAPVAAGGETFETIRQWSVETFGPVTNALVAKRAAQEMDELLAEPDRVEEAADVGIVLTRYPGLWEAVERKMAVNRASQWRFNGDGTGYRIKADPPPPSPVSLGSGSQSEGEA